MGTELHSPVRDFTLLAQSTRAKRKGVRGLEDLGGGSKGAVDSRKATQK